MKNSDDERGLYLMLISAHGLIRGENLELGRDPDTGGQVTYVVELTRALAEDPRVERVDLLTRQVIDKRVDPAYEQSVEPLSENANIVRIPCGPRRYLRKERLWPHLDSFTDHALYHVRMAGRTPDVIHGHYADAGYVGSQLARLLGVPFVFTGHSLGRVKLQRLIEKGVKAEAVERQFAFRQRIEAEETALDTAAKVVVSTRQEVQEQYEMYDHYAPERMVVIPPGVDLSRFRMPEPDDPEPAIAGRVHRFLSDPSKPMVLAMARPDERKNFPGLIRAFAENPALREKANLVLIAGNRDAITEMDAGSRRVLTQILLMIDEFDLHGSVAYPKHHEAEEVPGLYNLAARSRGVFVNPALTEPFGLTLIEAAASGLPIVATHDGGPQDIVDVCQNGLLVDPLDPEAIGRAILEVLSDEEEWTRRAERGLEGVHRRFTWTSHVQSYLSEVEGVLSAKEHADPAPSSAGRLPRLDRILVTDVDNTLIGDTEGLDAFVERMREAGHHIGFGIATGRTLDSARALIEELDIPSPDLMITSTGTEIYYGEGLTPDRSWRNQIDYFWEPDRVREVLDALPGLYLQKDEVQTGFKISYTRDPEDAPLIREIRKELRQHKLRAKVIYSLGMFLDIIPIRAGDGLAIRHLAIKWGVPPERLLIVGDSGNDEEMLSGNTLGVVVGNYGEELEHLRGRERIYFARGQHAWGILEGIDYYNFFDDIRIPTEEDHGQAIE